MARNTFQASSLANSHNLKVQPNIHFIGFKVSQGDLVIRYIQARAGRFSVDPVIASFL